MMHKLFILTISIFLICCNNKKKVEGDNNNNRIVLRSDTINVVKLTDTLLIQESTCRGCAYEKSTHFDISDSLGLIKLQEVITTDNNSPDMDGGSIKKDLILVPVKTGITTFKLYKFWEQKETAEDSTGFSLFSIEIQN